MQQDAGFAAPASSSWKLSLEFESWIARIGTPPARIAALQTVFAEFPGEVKAYFKICADLSFVTDSAWIETSKLRA